MARSRGLRSIFLNLPFERRYENLFIALIMGITALGRTPRCVLEVPDSGIERSRRIFELIRFCRISIHDLSLVQPTGRHRLPRFNMPFELGLAVALTRLDSGHRFFIFEERIHRLPKTLSDLAGHDPQIHRGCARGVLAGLLNWLGTTEGSASPSLRELEDLTRRLEKGARTLKRQYGARDIFSAQLFRLTVAAATELTLRWRS